MQTITFNDKKYYLADDVYKAEPARFPNCSKTVRNIIATKGLIDEQYVYLKQSSKGEFSLSNSAYPRAKLYLIDSWVHKNLTQFKKVKNEEDIKIENMKLPPLLELSDEEKFKDGKGNILEIEIRGERHHEKCYFKVKDIAEAFDIPSLSTTLLHKDKGYEREKDYVIFMKLSKEQVTTSKKSEGNQKSLFLTYIGLIRLLFVSRSKNAEHFQKWAIEKLFVVQMGTKEQKKSLADKLMGVSTKDVKEVLNVSVSPIASVYLCTLGRVEGLRKTLDIPDNFGNNWIVAKYGKTDDLKRRIGEHQNKLGIY